jgi:sugar O-acyltransferase (sialic acid O-acetyltransferase NeuD family)
VSESKQVFILGYSGHAYVVIESLLDAGYSIAGYFDYQEASKNPYHLSYLGFEGNEDVKSIVQNHLVFPAVGENSIREKLVHLFDTLELQQFVAIDPSAQVSKTAQVGTSSYIGKNVAINAQAIIGRGAIINTQATVEHECIVEDFVHIAPNAVLCGNVHVGKKSFLGANTVVRQNTNIIADVVVGSGSVVVKSIEEKGIWVGNPVKKI